ncbi:MULTISPECIES: sensor histidine kinase [Clostridium]|jgi:two-component system sensor histidine kinase AgrC|uniref:GHKL domain-containing protein n=2 Tax=Clostridium beijerinckii TaxID=1520 RepID=A0A1S8R0C5_CLOBE|nr:MULTISPECIES: GHKL domain-containing protein [Clostridium]ABR36688.1 sensor histidine kinase-like protein [Clostridium beijerinckii NCIMB 8052]AIU01349.1 sensor histidine kinase-like protein [Clostridium beijerinckii ATCC 35702]MBF7808666.1 GHKL domain-containing protein [Clostridium beijerinckii]NRT22241.1 two-component system sensor histidine kinase AgrC [Clostridium beijerinckii]NRT65249.1 two-component system sensor histidine kinase AgrC [Clostridium beijerinckii]
MTIKIFTSFVAMFAYVFVTYNLKIIEFKKKDFLLNLVIVYLISGIGCLNLEMLSLPLFFITMMILLFLQNKKIIQNFISIMLSIIIFIVSDTIQGAIFIELFNQDVNKLLDNNIIVILMHISLFFIALIFSSFVAYILKKFKFNLKDINVRNKFSVLIFSNIALTALIFYINAMIIKFVHVDNLIILIDSILFLSYFFLTIIMVYIVIIHFKNDLEYENKKIQFESLQEYTLNLESMYNDMRKFKHDYINILSSMAGYFEYKDFEKLEKFFNKKILKLSENISNENYKLDKLQNIKIVELKGILSSKVIRAQELGIDLFIDIMEPIQFIKMDIIDLCRSIGILLDNAIEAAILCKVPSVKIGIINKKNSTCILIINSCLDDTPPIYKMFAYGFSTKGSNRGCGLSNLKEILNNYQNISLETSLENGQFIQNIQVLNISK